MELLILVLSLCKYSFCEMNFGLGLGLDSFALCTYTRYNFCVFYIAVLQSCPCFGLESHFLSPAQPTSAKDAKFGCSVAIGSTGGYMVVGEKGYPQQAYVYVESGDTWSLTDTLVGADNEIGKFVAVYDETIVLSNHNHVNGFNDGHAFVYKLIGGKSLGTPFYVVTNYNVTLLFIVVYSLNVILHIIGSFSHTASLISQVSGHKDFSKSGVAVYGSTVAVGSDDDEKVSIFTDTGTFVESVAVTAVKGVAMYDSLIAARTDVAVYIFERISTAWTQTAIYLQSNTNIAIYSNTIVAGGSGTNAKTLQMSNFPQSVSFTIRYTLYDHRQCLRVWIFIANAQSESNDYGNWNQLCSYIRQSCRHSKERFRLKILCIILKICSLLFILLDIHVYR
jgi:hypothetical protein